MNPEPESGANQISKVYFGSLHYTLKKETILHFLVNVLSMIRVHPVCYLNTLFINRIHNRNMLVASSVMRGSPKLEYLLVIKTIEDRLI